MVRHTCHVWSESENRAGAETGLAAIADTLLGGDVSGDTLKVKIYNKIALMYMCQSSSGKAAYYPVRGRLSTPKTAGTPLILTKGWALAIPTIEGLVYDFREKPLDIWALNDTVTAYSYEKDESGVAHIMSIVIIVSDGPIPTGPQPKITHIATGVPAAATGAASTWKNAAITLSYSLDAGKWRCWGGRVVSATAIAARLDFPQHGIKPALIPVFQENVANHPFCDYFGIGVPFVMPGGLPNIEYVCGANETANHVNLYLEYLGP